MIYLGFAISDTMFNGSATVMRTTMTVDDVFSALPNVVSVANASHIATLDALRERFGLSVPVPPNPPSVSLRCGDSLIILSVRGLPRLTDRREYTAEEVASAAFSFARWDVIA